MATVATDRGFGFAPVSVPTAKPIELSMQRLWLTGRVTAAGGRLVVEHVFRSAERKPVEVVYCFGLPRDAALRRFRIDGEGFSVESSLRETAAAVAEYEEAIAAGALASLARQYPDGLVNLTVGNLRPEETVTVRLEVLAGVEARDGGFRFRFPFTLAPRYHARARMIASSEGIGEIELPEDEFGDLLLPPFHKEAADLHAVGFDLEVSLGGGVGEVGSPSHGLRVRSAESGRSRVWLAAGRDVPDRDLVLDAASAGGGAEVVGGLDESGRGHFVALVPSTSFGEAPTAPRRVVFVLDRSGSMNGAPMTQAKKALEACLGALGAADRFGIVAFDDQVEAFGGGLAEATRGQRDDARRFLERIEARGGTELAAGFQHAAGLLGGDGGDVMVLTDGQVAGTEGILGKARAAGIRIHTLGIGSAGEDRFLSQLARQTGGVSRSVTPRERVDLEAVELFSSIGRPVATGIRVEGAEIEPQPGSTVVAGRPLVVYGSVETGQGSLRVAWDGGGTLEVPLALERGPLAETARLLRGARLITDFESRYSADDEAEGATERRKSTRVAAKLKALSAEYGLASREMSLVAVVKRAGDRPGEVPDTRVVPVGMPQDTGFDSYFRFGSAMPVAPLSMLCEGMPSASPRRLRLGMADMQLERRIPREAAPPTGVDLLLELASRIEPDGGLPGRTLDQRVDATLDALNQFLDQGHTTRSGAFRTHVERLADFLRSVVDKLDPRRREAVEKAVARATVVAI